MTERRVSHFEYHWRPMLHIFSKDGFLMRTVYRQKKVSIMVYKGRPRTEYWLELHKMRGKKK